MAQVENYTPTAKWLHWVMAVIWIAAWVIGILATHWRDELNPHHEITDLHKAMATTVLVLIVVRVAWRLTHPAPAFPMTMSKGMKRAAFAGHLVLYVAALIALPVSGWYWSSVGGHPIMLAGLIPLPPLVDADQDMYGLAKAIHTYLSWLCGAVVAGHLLIALKHHFIDGDHILKGMLP